MTKTSPYRLEEPAVISLSGGRTSAYMLMKILDEYGGRLPADIHVLFADTHKERAETYEFLFEFENQFDIPIHWVERPGGFEQLITDKKFLPNTVARFCTTELKLVPIRDWMIAKGYENWCMVVGVRADEVHRMTRLQRGEGNDRWWYQFPLVDDGITEDDVLAFWRCNHFDLELKSYEGNCDLCFMKGVKKRVRILAEHPELGAWWAEQERRIGGTFRKNQPIEALMTRADALRRQLSLFDDADLDVTEGDCVCGD
jgi:3'-phosphoadenosine 5'-phosphosulfate sulfotransferase (PAPS reductase)/FAD synthetase